MKLAYADPPYPEQAQRHYANDPSGIAAEEVDHKALIEMLMRDYEGWALSTNVPGLEHIKDLFPKGFFKANGIRVCAWVKPWASWKPSNRIQYAWEPVLVKTPRTKGSKSVASVRDFLIANITMKKGTHGAKPDVFNDWILDLLGYQDGDTLDDLYPGSGGMAGALKRWAPKPPNKKKKVKM